MVDNLSYQGGPANKRAPPLMSRPVIPRAYLSEPAIPRASLVSEPEIQRAFLEPNPADAPRAPLITNPTIAELPSTTRSSIPC